MSGDSPSRTLGRRARPDDVVIGSVFSWILGLGAFFIALYTTSRSTTNGTAGVSVLFGIMRRPTDPCARGQ